MRVFRSSTLASPEPINILMMSWPFIAMAKIYRPRRLIWQNGRTQYFCGLGREAVRFSALQPVTGFEHPRHHRQADKKKYRDHRQAHTHADVRLTIETPAKTADQIDHRIEESNRAPDRGQHVDGVEGSAEKS